VNGGTRVFNWNYLIKDTHPMSLDVITNR